MADAAAIAKRSVRTIRRAYLRGSLRAYRDGGGRGVRIRYGDLERWLTDRFAAAERPSPSEAPPVARPQPARPPSVRGNNLTLLRAARNAAG